MLNASAAAGPAREERLGEAGVSAETAQVGGRRALPFSRVVAGNDGEGSPLFHE